MQREIFHIFIHRSYLYIESLKKFKKLEVRLIAAEGRMVTAKSGEKFRNGNTSKLSVVTRVSSRAVIDGIVAIVKSVLVLTAQPCSSIPSED